MHIHFLGKKISKPLAVTIGNFDGLHLGHKSLLSKLNKFASTHDMQSAAITFHPHPRKYFGIDNISSIDIDTLGQKITKLLNYVDNLLIINFSLKVSQLSAEKFILNLFRLNIKYIVVGDDFHFGNKRSANVQDLKRIAQKYNIQIEIINTLKNTNALDNKSKISSSSLRKSLQKADFKAFYEYTHSFFTYSSRVKKGKQIGRTIGFPTINLSVDENFILPKGIYAVYVKLFDDNNSILEGVASLGYRPTIECNNSNAELLLEVHILNYNQDLYSKKVKVIFLEKIRDEFSFSGLDELQKAIFNDIEIAKNIYPGCRKIPLFSAVI